MNAAAPRGAAGSNRSDQPISASKRSALRRLHRTQAATTFDHSFRPPRERGWMWSTVSAAAQHQDDSAMGADHAQGFEAGVEQQGPTRGGCRHQHGRLLEPVREPDWLAGPYSGTSKRGCLLYTSDAADDL